MKTEREYWVDRVKIFACFWVVMGHFFQSMVNAELLPDTGLFQWFNKTIYMFHVPLFFICSGYLYQKYSRVNDWKSWKKNIYKKAIVLGVPYFTFSIATWILKTVFSESVSNPVGGLGISLFVHPIPPYWYLLCLFLLFCITPTFQNANMRSRMLILAVAMKVLSIWPFNVTGNGLPTILQNEIWFVLGMSLVYADFQKVLQRAGIIGAVLFWILSVLAYYICPASLWTDFALGLLACGSIIIVAYFWKHSRVEVVLARYTMPVFLMHTLFAAPLRSILLKLGIRNIFIHLPLGLLISFLGPVCAAVIMKKTRYLEFFFYPGKFIHMK